MVRIPADTYIIGTNFPVFKPDAEGPARKVTLRSFFLDVTEVTNKQFETFVNATGYRTEVNLCILLE
jgi:sulfatase modifying factor 1